MALKIKNILFDLDGTLTDPKEGIINSILYSLNKLNITEPTPSELDSFIGPPLRNSFIERYKLSDSEGDDALKFYREYFSERGLYENIPYSGIDETLNKLRSENYNLFVATSKPTVFAKKILQHFKLDKYFTAIIGSNLDNSLTEKTEVIAHIINLHKLIPEECLMIGDRKFDIIGAKENGITSVGVTYGYGTLEEFSLCKPDFTINNCYEINSLLKTISGQ